MGKFPTGLIVVAGVVHFSVPPRDAAESPFTKPLYVAENDGFGASTTLLVLSAWIVSGAGVTVSVPLAVEAAKFPCAAKLAESEWLPAFRTPRLNVAE